MANDDKGQNQPPAGQPDPKQEPAAQQPKKGADPKATAELRAVHYERTGEKYRTTRKQPGTDTDGE